MVKSRGMEKSIIMDEIQSMLYQSRDGVFSVWLGLKEVIKEKDLIKVFLLINKYYPQYYIKSDDYISERKSWEEYLISNFNYIPSSFNSIFLSAKFYIQNEKGELMMIEPEDDGIEIIYGSDNDSPVFGIQFYPYVYFDLNKIYYRDDDSSVIKFKMVDQSLAAKKNRAILSAFLKDLEELLNTNISFFQAGKKYSPNYVYKYGFKEDVVLY